MLTMSSPTDRKSTRLNSSHTVISYAVFCLKKKNNFRASLSDDEDNIHIPVCVVVGVQRFVPVLRRRAVFEVAGGRGYGVFGVLFVFDDTATAEIYTLSLHDALPI